MRRISISSRAAKFSALSLLFLLFCGPSSLFAQLSGTYTVGAAGTYSTITTAVAAYNSSSLAGPVTFVLTDATYPGETFPITINNNADASATNTLTIMPAAGVAVSITGTSSSPALFKLLDARYITIDGVNTGGSSLTLTNANTGTSATIWLASTATTGPGCKNIALKSMNINGGSNSTSSDWGIIAGVNGTNPSTTAGMDNDSVTVQGNTFLKCGYGIYAKGTAAVTAGGLDGWNISNNTIGPATTGTTNIGYNGIYLANALSATIANNIIQFVGSGITSQVVGINLNTAVNGVTVSQNTIKNVSSSASTSGTNANTGMYLGSNVINATIDRNYVTSIANTSTGGYGVRGITINTGNTASNITLSNNMISDIWCYADVSFIYDPVGIDIEGTSGGINLYFNSVNLFGSHTGYSSGGTHAADMYMNSSGGNINVRDNVFVNSYDNATSSSDKSYTIYSNYSASSYSAIDYNDYYVSAPAGVLAYLSSDQTTLSAIQASFGGNTHSINAAPLFVSGTDLHLQVAGSNAPLVAGLPIAGITTDIDGATRSITAPVIGAHEVILPICSSVTAGTASPATAAFCASGSAVISLSGATAGLGINYQWQSSPDSLSWTPIAGATSFTYTTPTITSTTFYRVVLTCSFSGVSDSATTKVVIHSLPTISVTPDGGGICTGSAGLSMTASGAATYTWAPGLGLSSTAGATVTATPSVTTTYTVTGTDGFGCSNTHASTVAVTITPAAVTITPTVSAICPGGAQALTAATIITGPGTALSQDFNSGLGSWTIDNTGTTSTYPNVTWTVHGDGYVNELGTYHSPDHSGFILTNSDTAGSGVTVHSILISPSFSLSDYTAATLSFQHNYRYYSSGDVNASVEISTDGGTTWTLLHDYKADGVTVGTTTGFVAASLDLTAYAGMPNLMVRFNYHSVYGYDWAIDNIVVSGTVNIPVTNITWSGTGLYNDAALTSAYTGGTATTVYASPAAAATYTATATNGACTSTGTATVTVNPAADAGIITGSSAVCPGATLVLSDAAAGGTWSSSNGHASVSATGVVTGVTAGIDTISYVVTNVCGTATATKVITVNPLPNAGIITGPSSVCESASVLLTDAATGGIWSSSNSHASVAGGTVTGLSAGTSVISYSVTNSCGTAVATKTIVVHPLPVAGSISGATAVCVSSTMTLTDAAPGGVWSSGSTNAAIDSTGVVTGLSAGTAVLSYTVVNGCGTATAVHTIIVNPLPAVFTVTGGGAYCEGGAGVSVGLSGSETGITYQLYSAGAAMGSPVAGTGGPIDFGMQTAAGTYVATATNTSTGCTSNMGGSTDIVVNPTASPLVHITTSTGDTVCASTAVTFTAITENGGASPAYTWSVNGAVVSTFYTYSYIPANGDVVSVTVMSSSCAMPNTASDSVTMTVTSVVTPSVSIVSSTSSDSSCADYPVTFTAIPVNGGSAPTYTWTRNGINVATGPTFTFIPASGDVLYVTMTSSLPCALGDSVASSHHILHTVPLLTPTVTIHAHPGLSAPVGVADTFTATVINGGTSPSYQWKVNGTSVPGATSAVFITSALASGDVVSCYVTSGGLCSGLSTYASVTFTGGSTGVSPVTNEAGDIRIFPNPNKGVFTVKGDLGAASEEVTLEVTDMLGQVVYNEKIKLVNGQLNEQVSLNNSLANGAYTLRVQGNSERYTSHFVISR